MYDDEDDVCLLCARATALYNLLLRYSYSYTNMRQGEGGGGESYGT